MPLKASEVIDQSRQGASHPGQSFILGQSLSIPPRNDHGVGARGQSLALEVERLAQKSFDPVAIHSAAHLAGYRESNTRAGAGLATREDIQNQFAAGVRAAVSKDTVEVCAAGQPATPRSRPGAGRAQHQTVKRLRPLSRRRLSVSRPARVCMRARNPWVLARLRFFGW
jgi:hypothetical protein